jgi:hypothetical protein
MYRRRRQVADEVLSTEASYCTSLSALVDVAIAQLKDILTDEENKLLFSNIATILQFNQNFCDNLDQRLKRWDNDAGLGDIFLQFTPYLKMYTQYVSNHEAATTFDRELSQQPRFNKIAHHIFGNPRMAGSSSLSNFLIMPIQRIPRYSLLLGELIKTTPEDHVDLPLLKKALEQVNEVAHKVNAEITAQQNRQLVYEKTQLLGLDEARFIQPSRHFVRQGTMTKVCRSKDSIYEFFLFNDVLIYASKSPVGKFKVHQEIPIDSSFGIQDAKDDDKRENQFKIINSIKSFAVYTDSAESKAQWMKLLTNLIQQAKSKIQSKEDGQGAIVPVWIPDDQAKGCLCCKSDFTFFNRKHHCRFCGGVVCGGCSKRKAMLRGKEERICDQCVDLRTKYNRMQMESEEIASPATANPLIAASSQKGTPASKPATRLLDLSTNPELYKPSPIRYRALQENQPNDVGDLPFKQGETLLVYFRSPDGWWTATNLQGDVNGIFPSDLVEVENPKAPEPTIVPICSALVVADPPTDRVGLPANSIMYDKGQILVVMHELKDKGWSLSYNLTTQLIGWVPTNAIVPLNSGDEETTISTPELGKLPSMPLPASPPQSAVPPTPKMGPPSSPPPAAPTTTTATSPPANSSGTLPKPSAPPPARNIGTNTTTAAAPVAGANQWDGPLPAGKCKTCTNCEAYRSIPIRKAVCSDCGHGAAEHNAK